MFVAEIEISRRKVSPRSSQYTKQETRQG